MTAAAQQRDPYRHPAVLRTMAQAGRMAPGWPAKGRVPPEELRLFVQRAIPRIFPGHTDASGHVAHMIQDTGGAGLCDYYSEHLARAIFVQTAWPTGWLWLGFDTCTRTYGGTAEVTGLTTLVRTRDGGCLERHEPGSAPFVRLPDEYQSDPTCWFDASGEHCVTVVDWPDSGPAVGMWAIDLTARQYNPGAPFPFLWELRT